MAKKRHFYAYELDLQFTTKKDAQKWANFINDELDKSDSRASAARVIKKMRSVS